MKKMIKIGGQKTNLEDIPPILRNKIEEQLEKDNIVIDSPIKKEEMPTNNKKRNNPKRESIFRKMFGYKSGIFKK